MEDPSDKNPPSSDFVEEEGLEEKNLGKFGFTQFLKCIIVSLATLFDVQQAFISIYAEKYPTWRCTNTTATTCSTTSDICSLPKTSWTWDSDASTSVISQWGLECASSFMTGLPQSSFFLGCFLGTFVLASLADSSVGRKKGLFLSCLSASIASMLIIFSPNVWVYSAMKFVIGFFHSNIETIVLVLLTESVSAEWRFAAGIMEIFFYGIGYMSLPGIGYLKRNSSWKSLYMWTSAPAIFYSLVAYPFVSESPRWLLTQSERRPKENVSFIQLYSSIAELFSSPWVVKRSVAVVLLSTGFGMVYYGLSSAVGSFGFSIYLAGFLSALMEFPSCIATYCLDRCKRRVSIVVFSVVGAVCSMLCAVLGDNNNNNNKPKGIKLGLSTVSFFAICTANNVFLIYILELFPTSVRNTTTSLASQATVLGSIISPFLISVGRKNKFYSYGVFGAYIMFSNLSMFYLPETRGIVLSDTMDQQKKNETALNVNEMGIV